MVLCTNFAYSSFKLSFSFSCEFAMKCIQFSWFISWTSLFSFFFSINSIGLISLIFSFKILKVNSYPAAENSKLLPTCLNVRLVFSEILQVVACDLNFENTFKSPFILSKFVFNDLLIFIKSYCTPFVKYWF